MAEVVDLILRLPTYIRLVCALLRDGRVPAQQKLILVGMGASVILPIDLIPDSVTVLGQLDDLTVVLPGLDLSIRSAPADIVEEHLAKIRRTRIRSVATSRRPSASWENQIDSVRDTVEKFRQTTGRMREST
jgi:uncharacterized membrane protein YkvA (DUF1232 family)